MAAHERSAPFEVNDGEHGGQRGTEGTEDPGAGPRAAPGRGVPGCLVAVLAAIALMVIAAMALVSGLSARGDGGRTVRVLEAHAGRELPGARVEISEQIDKSRRMWVRVSAEEDSVEDVMDVHRVVGELRAMAGDARWGFEADATVELRGRGTPLDVGFAEDSDAGELRGVMRVELGVSNVGDGPGDAAFAIERIDAMLREIAATRTDGPKAAGEVPVRIEGARDVGPLDLVVGGCSEKPPRNDAETRLRAGFERC